MARGHFRIRLATLLACGSAVLVSLTGQAQDPPSPTIGFTDEVSVEWVTVPVFGPAVDDRLNASSFRLRVDGAPVHLESFDRADSPMGILYAQDLSGSMALGGRLGLSRQVIALVQAGIHRHDEIGLVTFAGPDVRLQVPFTSDLDLLGEAPGAWRGYGTTALYDAIAAIPALARQSRRARRGVVLVTDGADNASAIDPQAARELLAGAGLPLFVLDVDQSFGDPQEPPLLPELSRDRLTLVELALATGGRYEIVADRGAAQRAALDLIADLRRQVLLGFTVQAGEEEAWHDIQVELRRWRGELRYRSRYFGAPPTPQEPARLSLRRETRPPPAAPATHPIHRTTEQTRSDS